MQKLHLVGFTTDHEGLILSARRGARSGGYLLAIDASLEEAVDDLRAKRAEEADGDGGDVAVAAPSTPRVESALSVKEIQARLRQGRSVAEVARAAGVDAEWVERFAPPVFAERAQVIRKVRASSLRRARLGPSSLPIGDAVRHHLADRGVAQTADEFADAWAARQIAEGRWAVRFTFRYRGKDQVLRFDLDESDGSVRTVDRASGDFGYVHPTTSPSPSAERTRREPPRPEPEPRPTAKRAVVSTGFRAQPVGGKATSRSAKEREKAAASMRKAAARRAVETERAASRKAKERRDEAARQARAAKAAEQQKARDERARADAAKRAAAARAAAKAATAKQAQLTKAARATKATAGKGTATKPTTAVAKAPAAKAAARKATAPARKATAPAARPGQATARKAPATKTTKATTSRAIAAKATQPPGVRATRSIAPTPSPPRATAAAATPTRGAATTTSAALTTPPPARAAAADVVRSAVRVRPERAPAARPASRTLPQDQPATRSARRGDDGSSAEDLRPRAAVRDDPLADDGLRLTPAAGGVHATESARALFRRGLVEQAQGDGPAPGPDGAVDAPTNGGASVVVARPAMVSSPVPPTGAPIRPRRTRPLRAT